MPDIYIWKKAPFIRILISLITGILVQWYLQLAPLVWCTVLIGCTAVGVLFFYIPLVKRYKLGFLNGVFLLTTFVTIGALLTWTHDIRNSKNWMGHYYHSRALLVATLDETPVEKTNSLKANASISMMFENGKNTPVNGKVILYFKRDSLLPAMSYGSQLIIQKPLQEITNSGNPGGFDYKQYCLFREITHQVYLKPAEFSILATSKKQWLPSFLGGAREKVLNILRANIHGDKELGLAEALLIGYKDDLDKTLVQSYTNTGVVHIIAISGLHLGLIYWLLVQLLKPLQRRKYMNWLRPLIIILGLWLFSLLAGAQPSILRSAVMFSCIVIGETIAKKTSIYNSLAFSAFGLLCWNPYWLWDVGFQLSYSAVLSIIIFMQPVYNLLYVKNRILDFFWKINAVTIAAQILTLPLSIFHFHQFPVYFILTNFITVPLSSIILFGEILLCAMSFIPVMPKLAGEALYWLIRAMNGYVERIESLPFSLWDSLQINMLQAAFLFFFLACASYWLLEKKKPGLYAGLLALFCFFGLRSYSFWEAGRQQKIIVYNIPQYKAIDFINNRRYFFAGDESLLENDFAENFHLKPSRILQRVAAVRQLRNLTIIDHYVSFNDRHILLIDNTFSFSKTSTRHPLDLVVVSKSPKLSIGRLNNSFVINQMVFDGSVPASKLKYWKKDCDSLHIPYYDVSEKGAFVMNLN
jgi:competence protein ComEC